MRDVVIIGGGLTGLAAAAELAHYPEIDCTLIEVKRHLGGSISSLQRDGCLFDGAAFAVQDTLDPDWLAQLGLNADIFFPIETLQTPLNALGLKGGTRTLIEALAHQMRATRLMRMAVSSIGELKNGRFGICLENGLLFDARALILAVPARYAERMFYGYISTLTEQLLDYHYDSVYRVSVVCATDALPSILNPPEMGHLFIHRTEHSSRVPSGKSLLQFGLRLQPSQVHTDEALVQYLQARFDLPTIHAWHVAHWSEADPLSCYDDQHAAWVASLRAQLPASIALVGSDYCLQAPMHYGIARLDERIAQGIGAAQQVLATL